MKIHVIIFTLGLLLGLFFSFMYRALLIDPVKPPVSKRSVVELKKEVNRSEITYTKSVDSLKKQSAKLEIELVGTKKTLSEVKKQNQSLKNQVYALIDRRSDLTLETPEDNSCDSLIGTVEYLIQSNSQKDSLYEAITVNLEDQLRNKDSTQLLKDSLYKNLKSAFDQSLFNQEQLISETKILGKQVKKQKLKSKALSAVFFILSGVAINHFLQH